MGRVLEITNDLLKLRYYLFNKSKNDVHYKVAHIEYDDSRKLATVVGIVEEGTIDYDANIDSTKYEEEKQEICNPTYIDCSVADDFNDYNGTPVKVQFTCDIDTFSMDPCKFGASIRNGLKYVEDNNSTQTIRYMNFYNEKLSKEKEDDDEFIYIDLKDYKDKKDIYVIFIYPNNYLPAFIRIYEDNKFNILNLDDPKCIYNSYYDRVTMETIVTNRQKIRNLPYLTYENDKDLHTELQQLVSDSIDNDGTYHNDILNLNANFDKGELSIAGVNFEDTFSGEYCQCDSLTVLPDDVTSMINELIDDDNIEFDLKNAKICESKTYNNHFSITYEDPNNKKFKITAYLNCKFVPNSVNDNDDHALLLVAIKKKFTTTIYLVDLIAQDIMITAEIINTHSKAGVSIINYQDIKGLKFEYVVRNMNYLSYHDDPITIINKFNNIKIENIANYQINQKSKINDGKLVAFDLASSLVYNEKDNTYLVRGLLGNLIKVNL